MDEVLVSCPIDGEVWPRSFVAVSRYPAISFCFNAFFCGQLKKWALKAVFQKLFVDNEMWIVYLLSSDLSSCGTVQLQIIAIDIDTLIPACRKGVDGFSVETAGSGKHPFSPSSDSLTDALAPTVHKPCHNQASCGLCDAQFLRL
ncbi:hypothetical protein AVEN_71616-1 [Araneus ventricosus]|uniref:Uncharacterized protein n=1 Tax=Araneus ventricosus TaxID=182803 RepID=A0A4Y2GD19_ARAVE|nr:hypothetical protein AVEN_71616-1 [Araneus ventricosus]